MELKQINVSDILANFYQPRTKFDKDKTKELAESILSNGLVNPITVRKWKDKRYMIVSGERRWRSHKIANIKTVPCVVKEYKSDGQFMVESLIENLHRDDLSPQESSKFARRIMKEEGIVNVHALSKRLSLSRTLIASWFDADDMRKKLPKEIQNKVSPTVIYETKGLPENQRIDLIKEAVKEDFGGSKMRQIVSNIKAEDRPLPIQLERTANDVGNDIMNDLTNFRYHTAELLKMNLEDLEKDNANQLMTTSGLHMKHFKDFVNTLRQRGAKPDKLILALIKSNNGKV